MKTQLNNLVTQVPAAAATPALTHFQAKLSYETDCWDVHASEALDERGFVLVDVRSATAFAEGHLPGAINIPHPSLTEPNLERYARDELFVVYCAGPHCNGSTRAALRLARLDRPVKEMIGGITGWLDEGFKLTKEASA